MILVRDIIPDAKRVLGQCGNETIFSKLSDATEILATMPGGSGGKSELESKTAVTDSSNASVKAAIN